MIIYSTCTPVTFNKFLYYYKQKIEERFLCDVKFYNSTYPNSTWQRLQDVFAFLEQMKVDPLKFLDRAFEKIDHIPSPVFLLSFLKNYKDEGRRRLSYFEFIDKEIRDAEELAVHYDTMIDFYIAIKPYPFLLIFDDDIKRCIWREKFPDGFDNFYIEQIYCAYYLIDSFTDLKTKLKNDWLPVLRRIKCTKLMK